MAVGLGCADSGPDVQWPSRKVGVYKITMATKLLVTYELHNVCWLRFGCNLKRRKHLGWAVVCKFVFAVSCIFERFEFGTNFLENGNASHLKDANRL